MEIIRWGVIGCGGIADRRTIPEGMIPAKNSKLEAVMDVNEEIMREIARKYGVKGYTREEDMLKEPNVDAVYIATPNYLHARQSITAAAAGKHVLCEKPLAPTVKECEDIISTCQKNNVKLQVGFMMRFHACHQEALRIIKKGLIGHPVLVRAQLTCWYPEIPGAWRQDPKMGGGGCLMDMGIHCIDLLRMFLGEVEEVSTFTDRLIFNYPVEDTSIVTLRFDGKAYGIVDNFFNIPDAAAQNRLEIYGTKGCILADGTIGQESIGKLKVYIQEDKQGYEAAQIREAPGMRISEISPKPINMYKAEIEHFIKCIQEDSEPINSGHEAIKNLKTVLAAYESSKLGKKIKT
jgi:predicted dehydrogenase